MADKGKQSTASDLQSKVQKINKASQANTSANISKKGSK